jgi:outer membrane protein TolC
VAQQEYDAFDRQLQAAITAATASAQSLEDQKLQKAQKKLDLDRLTQDAASEKKRLAKLIGADEGLMLNFKFPGFPASLNIPEDWGKQSLPTTPTSLQYESQAREQKDFMIESRAETRPTLDFVTGFYQNQVESVDVAHQVEQTNYFVGLRLRWEIFNGFRSEASAAAARARQRRLNALAHQELSAARDSFVDDMNALKNSAADYALALERRKIASDQYDAQAALQKQGQASTDAFDAAKRAFDASEIAALEKLTDYLKLYEKIQRTLELAKNS